MEDVFAQFDREIRVNEENKTIADLFECQKAYAQLIREYQEEFNYIQESLERLRCEQRSFYEDELPKIIDVLKLDEVREESRKIWIEELQRSMSKSFQMSERLLNDLAIKQMDEFKREAEEIIKEGK